MRTSKEVSKMDEFTVVFVFDVNNAPFVGAGTDQFSVDIESFFGTYDGERNFVLSISQEVREGE